jgi:hypothetical protein
MRILSNFKDYYDHACAYGIDESVIYVRETEEFMEKEVSPGWGIRPSTLVICGREWPLRILRNEKIEIPRTKEWILHGQDCYKFVPKVTPQGLHPSKLELLPFVPRKKGYQWWRDKWKIPQKDPIDKAVAAFHRGEISEKYAAKCREYNAPLLLIERNKITKNPNLADLGFGKIVQSYLLFQEIEQWITNNRPQMPMPDLPDDIMRDSKGFDKNSFKSQDKKGKPRGKK